VFFKAFYVFFFGDMSLDGWVLEKGRQKSYLVKSPTAPLIIVLMRIQEETTCKTCNL